MSSRWRLILLPGCHCTKDLVFLGLKMLLDDIAPDLVATAVLQPVEHSKLNSLWVRLAIVLLALFSTVVAGVGRLIRIEFGVEDHCMDADENLEDLAVSSPTWSSSGT